MEDIFGMAGWVFNLPKDQLPGKGNVILGVVANRESLLFEIPEAKMLEIECLIQFLLKKKYSRVRMVACLMGKIISLMRCTGAVARVMT